jgi:hypothetical protein
MRSVHPAFTLAGVYFKLFNISISTPIFSLLTN